MAFDDTSAFVKVVAATLGPLSKGVLVNLQGFAAGEDATGAETSTEEPVYGQLGVLARPLPADARGHAEMIAARTSDGLTPHAGRDLRVSTARGNLAEGAVSLAGYGGGFVSLQPADSGTGDLLTLYAPFQHPDGQGAGTAAKAHCLVLDTAEGNESIVLAHAGGCSVIFNQDNELVLRNSDGSQTIVLKEAEINVNGVIKLFGGIVAGNSQTAQAVALYPALAAFMGALPALLVALDAVVQGAAGASATSGVTPAHATAWSTAKTAVDVAAAAVAAPATGGSQTLKASPI